MKLTGTQAKSLNKALLSANPSYSILEQMVRFELGENLAEIAGNTNQSDCVFKLVQWAETNGQVQDLLAGAMKTNKGNPDLQEWISTNVDQSTLKQSKLKQSKIIKYFTYISSTKIAMLYPQIPRSFLDEQELRGDELPLKCHAVTEYLRQNVTLGTIASPSTYISDIVSLQYGVVSDESSDEFDIAFFGGNVDNIKFGLIGASSSMIGGVEASSVKHVEYYYTMGFLSGLIDTDIAENEPLPYELFSKAVEFALGAIPQHTYSCEFIAKTIYQGPELVVATPIYVAHAQ